MYGYELSNKHLGIIGLGKIGSKVANIGKKFNMKIYASVKNVNKKRKETLMKKKNNFNFTQSSFKAIRFCNCSSTFKQKNRKFIK